MKVLSFVIPAYNSEKFLDKAIPSMLVPEILDKLEIIVVNDGSTDGTAAAAEKYCAEYTETVRLISQENKGHGGALNTGIAAASGKYVKVIDADDWVESGNLPKFISCLEGCESDVVLTHFNTVDITSGEVRKWKSFPEVFCKPLTFGEIMQSERDFFRVLCFHGITYKTDFYRQFGIRLSEHVFYEDFEFATFPCCFANSVTPLDLFVYDYRVGDVTQSVSDAAKLKRITHLETVLRRLIAEKKRAALPDGGKAYVRMKTSELLMSYFTTVLLSEPDKKKGRKAADGMLAVFRIEYPEVAAAVEKKYKVFRLLNRLHISKGTWEALMRSRLYRKLRGEADFS